MHPKSLLLSISLVTIFLNSSVSAVRQYDDCPPINTTCGTVAKIIYPFWDSRLPEYCGDPAFKLDCLENSSLTINIENQKYKVLEISYDYQELAISKSQFPNNNQSNLCPVGKNLSTNTTFDSNHFYLTSDSQNATLFYDCISTMFGLDRPYSFLCDDSLSFLAINETWVDTLRERCGTEMYVPILRTAAEDLSEGKTNIATVLSSGFKLKWMIDNSKCNICRKSKGRCGFLNQTICFCKDGTNGPSCDGTNVNYSHTPPGSKISTRVIIIAIVVPLVTLLVALLVTIICCARYKKTKNYDVAQSGDDFTTVESLQYDLATLQYATNNFSVDDKLGEGGFGSVYKGALSNGQRIAVKRLSINSSQGLKEFKNEIALVAKLQHRNLVRLLGFCLEGQEKLIVYEYVPNKSLDNFLFDPENLRPLDWGTRYKIIVGIARGMLYLHQDSQLRIIHRDLKASNVLLDADMNAKVSDFGLAKIFVVDQSQGNTSRVVGTYGYMSPEYAMHGQFSNKSDVYSFGVLVLEIISGKRNSSFHQSGEAQDLLGYAWIQWRDGMALEFVDPTIRDSCSMDEVMRCIHLGLLCVQESSDDRPTMATAVLTLDSYSVTLAVPEAPGFYMKSRLQQSIAKENGSDPSSSKSTPWSVNDVSITEPEPR